MAEILHKKQQQQKNPQKIAVKSVKMLTHCHHHLFPLLHRLQNLVPLPSQFHPHHHHFPLHLQSQYTSFRLCQRPLLVF